MDSILRYLDVLIGFALVMALTSSFVTLLTQFILSFKDKRTKFLELGIAELLKRADSSLAQHADEIAAMVLQSGIAKEKRQVIMREQLVRRLLEIVAAHPFPPVPTPAPLVNAKNALANLLPNASNLLERIDHKACQLEVEHPEFASHVVHTQAIVEANAGKFIDAIMTRFDSMSESLTSLFSLYSRRVIFIVSLLVALVLPLDSIDLLQRLSTDDTMRETLVTEAIKESASYEKPPKPTPQELQPNIQPQAKVANGTDQQSLINSPGLTPKAKSVNNNLVQPIKSGEVAINPKVKELEADASRDTSNQQTMLQSKQGSPNAVLNTEFEPVKDAWTKLNDPKLSLVSRGGWSEISKSGQVWETILGCLLTALLMTIGAPFWFEVLKNLLKLRPSMAKTDDEAREKRRKDETIPQA